MSSRAFYSMINFSGRMLSIIISPLSGLECRRLHTICRSMADMRAAANSSRTLVARPTASPIMTSRAAADSGTVGMSSVDVSSACVASVSTIVRFAKGIYQLVDSKIIRRGETPIKQQC